MPGSSTSRSAGFPSVQASSRSQSPRIPNTFSSADGGGITTLSPFDTWSSSSSPLSTDSSSSTGTNGLLNNNNPSSSSSIMGSEKYGKLQYSSHGSGLNLGLNGFGSRGPPGTSTSNHATNNNNNNQYGQYHQYPSYQTGSATNVGTSGGPGGGGSGSSGGSALPSSTTSAAAGRYAFASSASSSAGGGGYHQHHVGPAGPRSSGIGGTMANSNSSATSTSGINDPYHHRGSESSSSSASGYYGGASGGIGMNTGTTSSGSGGGVGGSSTRDFYRSPNDHSRQSTSSFATRSVRSGSSSTTTSATATPRPETPEAGFEAQQQQHSSQQQHPRTVMIPMSGMPGVRTRVVVRNAAGNAVGMGAPKQEPSSQYHQQSQQHQQQPHHHRPQPQPQIQTGAPIPPKKSKNHSPHSREGSFGTGSLGLNFGGGIGSGSGPTGESTVSRSDHFSPSPPSSVSSRSVTPTAGRPLNTAGSSGAGAGAGTGTGRARPPLGNGFSYYKDQDNDNARPESPHAQQQSRNRDSTSSANHFTSQQQQPQSQTHSQSQPDLQHSNTFGPNARTTRTRITSGEHTAAPPPPEGPRHPGTSHHHPRSQTSLNRQSQQRQSYVSQSRRASVRPSSPGSASSSSTMFSPTMSSEGTFSPFSNTSTRPDSSSTFTASPSPSSTGFTSPTTNFSKNLTGSGSNPGSAFASPANTFTGLGPLFGSSEDESSRSSSPSSASVNTFLRSQQLQQQNVQPLNFSSSSNHSHSHGHHPRSSTNSAASYTSGISSHDEDDDEEPDAKTPRGSMLGLTTRPSSKLDGAKKWGVTGIDVGDIDPKAFNNNKRQDFLGDYGGGRPSNDGYRREEESDEDDEDDEDEDDRSSRRITQVAPPRLMLDLDLGGGFSLDDFGSSGSTSNKKQSDQPGKDSSSLDRSRPGTSTDGERTPPATATLLAKPRVGQPRRVVSANETGARLDSRPRDSVKRANSDIGPDTDRSRPPTLALDTTSLYDDDLSDIFDPEARAKRLSAVSNPHSATPSSAQDSRRSSRQDQPSSSIPSSSSSSSESGAMWREGARGYPPPTNNSNNAFDDSRSRNGSVSSVVSGSQPYLPLHHMGHQSTSTLAHDSSGTGDVHSLRSSNSSSIISPTDAKTGKKILTKLSALGNQAKRRRSGASIVSNGSIGGDSINTNGSTDTSEYQAFSKGFIDGNQTLKPKDRRRGLPSPVDGESRSSSASTVLTLNKALPLPPSEMAGRDEDHRPHPKRGLARLRSKSGDLLDTLSANMRGHPSGASPSSASPIDGPDKAFPASFLTEKEKQQSQAKPSDGFGRRLFARSSATPSEFSAAGTGEDSDIGEQPPRPRSRASILDSLNGRDREPDGSVDQNKPAGIWPGRRKSFDLLGDRDRDEAAQPKKKGLISKRSFEMLTNKRSSQKQSQTDHVTPTPVANNTRDPTALKPRTSLDSDSSGPDRSSMDGASVSVAMRVHRTASQIRTHTGRSLPEPPNKSAASSAQDRQQPPALGAKQAPAQTGQLGWRKRAKAADFMPTPVQSTLTAGWLEVEEALGNFVKATPSDRGPIVSNTLLPFVKKENAALNTIGADEEIANRQKDIFFGWLGALLEELQQVQPSHRGACLDAAAGIAESRYLSAASLENDPGSQARYRITIVRLISFAIEKLNDKAVYANTLVFSGRLFALAFFRIEGVAVKLLRALPPVKKHSMKRILTEAGLDETDLPPTDPELFPRHLWDLCYSDLGSYHAKFSPPPRGSIEEKDEQYLVQTEDLVVEMAGNWLLRWTASDSDLPFAFYRQYHRQLTTYLLPQDSLQDAMLRASIHPSEYVGAPGFLFVASSLMDKCDSLIHRTLRSVTSIGPSSGSVNANESASISMGQKPKVLELANRRLVSTILDIIGGPPRLPDDPDISADDETRRHLFGGMLKIWMRAVVKRTSLWDTRGVFLLLDFFEGLVYTACFPPLPKGAETPPPQVPVDSSLDLFDIPFILSFIKIILNEADNTVCLMRTIAFLYAHFEVLTLRKGDREELCENMLLDLSLFQRLFLSFNVGVRGYFQRLMVWRLSRIGASGDHSNPERDPLILRIFAIFNGRLESVRKRHEEIDPIPDFEDNDDDPFKPKRSTICSTRGVKEQPWTVDEVPLTEVEVTAEEEEAEPPEPEPENIEQTKRANDVMKKGVNVSSVVSWLKVNLKPKKGGKRHHHGLDARIDPFFLRQGQSIDGSDTGMSAETETETDVETDSEAESATERRRPTLELPPQRRIPSPPPEIPQQMDSGPPSPSPTFFSFDFEGAELAPRSDAFDPAPSTTPNTSPPNDPEADSVFPAFANPLSPRRRSEVPKPSSPSGSSHPISPRVSLRFSKRASILPPPALTLLTEGGQPVPQIPEQFRLTGYDRKLHPYASRSLREYEDALDEFEMHTLWKAEETAESRGFGDAVPRLAVAWPSLFED